ncbi:MAG: hypothetical protein HY721_01530 [Planctomycetes bacterium]|nr:hypothetical protein [Planctomycetota bacterium]
MIPALLPAALLVFGACPSPPPERHRVGLRAQSVEVPEGAATVEVDLFATGVSEKFPVSWVTAIAYDPEVLELVDLVEPPEVGDHPGNYFYTYPEYPGLGLALLDCRAESFLPRELTPGAEGEAKLATLVFRVLARRDSRVDPLATFYWHGGGEYPSSMAYCGGISYFADGPLVAGEITVARRGPAFIRGDSDSSGRIDMTDAIAVLYKLFLGRDDVACEDAADADDSGRLNMTDAISIADHLFRGGRSPPPPYPEPGPDPTPDGLGCK